METTSRETIFISNAQTPSPSKWRSGFLKRAFDIFASALGLLFLSPLFGLLAIAIKRDSPGPVFYRGPRLGLGGKPFGILKFRTMREEAASYDGPRVTAEGDLRITPLGKWLRDTKLNELPQLWNVLVGEMSLVGPRPEDPELAESWPRELREEVLSVRPGITSPASVLFRDEEKLLSGRLLMETYLGDITPSKLRLDQLYVRHRNFLLDLDVLMWTLLVVLIPSLREKQPPEQYLFWGPISRLGRRYVNWFLLDTLTTLAAFGMAGVLLRLLIGPLDVGLLPALVIVVGFSVLFSAIAAAAGVQNISWANASASEALDLLPPVILSYLTALGVNIWLALLPNHILVIAALLAFGGYVVTRYRSRLLTGIISRWVGWRGSSLGLRERVLVMGAGETGQFAAWRLSRGQALAQFQVVGFVDDDMFRQGARLNGFSVLGLRRDIPELVRKHDIGLIVFAIHKISRGERREILKACRATGARVVTWPDMPDMLRTQPRTSSTGGGLGEGKPMQAGDDLLQWLDTLEEDLNQGDYCSALEQIHSLRVSLQSKNPPETGAP
jgi:lipopolysaccharide/colanic/teichoic acid biosynthesis glycosyltransferase